jgi:hypothetical protein
MSPQYHQTSLDDRCSETNDFGDDVYIAVGISNKEKASPSTYQMMEMNVCHYHMLATRRKYQLAFY